MYLGDNLLRDGIVDLVDDLPQRAAGRADPAHAGARPGALRRGRADDGRVARLVEKPKDPKTDLALVGVYMFTPAIFEAARAIEPSWRDELEITDAIQHLVDSGMRVDPHIVHGWWKDTGQVQDMLEANRLILDDLEERDRRRAGRLARGGPRGDRGGRPAGALHRPRAGDHRRAARASTDAYIGPYTAIGEDVTIEHAELEHSIVLVGLGITRPRVADRGEPDRQERAHQPRPGAAEGLPLRGGRQRGRSQIL